MLPLISDIATALEAIKKQKPLVVNITNFVVMNNTANALLALGASPIMAHSRQEMRELLSVADALIINIGTLDTKWIERMRYAASIAVELKLPVVLDPVGCGLSKLRIEAALSLSQLLAPLKNKVTIRANASEIIALAFHLMPETKKTQNKSAKNPCSQKKKNASQDKGLIDKAQGSQLPTNIGLDSLISSEQAIASAHALRAHYGFDFVISGQSDHLLSNQALTLTGGSEMMAHVTGMGCTFSALIGAAAALSLNKDKGLSAGLIGACAMAAAGKEASKHCQGPGSFQVAFLDALYRLDEALLIQHLDIKHLNNLYPSYLKLQMR
jgi:hydroxyethylthiazole kinase